MPESKKNSLKLNTPAAIRRNARGLILLLVGVILGTVIVVGQQEGPMSKKEIPVSDRIENAIKAKEPTFKAVGCPHCNQTGYRGRTGIYEWLRMTEEIRGLVLSRSPALLIRRQALLEGMETLRENGIRAVLAGATRGGK